MRKKKNKIALFTVFYPGLELYLDDFLSSLEMQSFDDFVLVIFNDGLSTSALKKYSLNFRIVEASGTPAKIRENGIKYLKSHGYDYVIFGDSDDFFEENRIEKSVEALSSYDIMVNDLSIVDNSGKILNDKYISNRVENNSKIENKFIIDKNIFGLTNSAVRLEKIIDTKIPENIVAVDWFLFSLALNRGANAIFTSETKTYYRQHGSNIVGLGNLSRDIILRGVNVKKSHYEAMFENCFLEYGSLTEDFKLFEQKMNNEVRFRENYLSWLVNKKEKVFCPLWWEEIILPSKSSWDFWGVPLG